MRTESVLGTSPKFHTLMRMSAREHYIAFCRRESFKTSKTSFVIYYHVQSLLQVSSLVITIFYLLPIRFTCFDLSQPSSRLNYSSELHHTCYNLYIMVLLQKDFYISHTRPLCLVQVSAKQRHKNVFDIQRTVHRDIFL